MFGIQGACTLGTVIVIPQGHAIRKPCGSKWDFGGSPRKGGWLRLGHGVQGGLGSPNDIGLGDKVEVETSTFAQFVAEEKASL